MLQATVTAMWRSSANTLVTRDRWPVLSSGARVGSVQRTP
jgi:hypothetical protein